MRLCAPLLVRPRPQQCFTQRAARCDCNCNCDSTAAAMLRGDAVLRRHAVAMLRRCYCDCSCELCGSATRWLCCTLLRCGGDAVATLRRHCDAAPATAAEIATAPLRRRCGETRRCGGKLCCAATRWRCGCAATATAAASCASRRRGGYVAAALRRCACGDAVGTLRRCDSIAAAMLR